MEPEPLIARIVPCPKCGTQNRIPAHSTTAHALCSACHPPLGTEHPEPAQARRELDPTSDKASRLFLFLKELVELRGRAVRTLDRYDTSSSAPRPSASSGATRWSAASAS